MYVKIRKQGENPGEDFLVTISKKSTIKTLRAMIFRDTGITENKQLLLYKGKQLNDEHTLLDYEVQLNDVIQLMIRTTASPKDCENKIVLKPTVDLKEQSPASSEFYSTGDLIDMRDDTGAWFEGIILEILQENNSQSAKTENSLIFKCTRQSKTEQPTVELNFKDIRPRSYLALTLKQVNQNLVILVNYNVEFPGKLGHWYDFRVKSKTRTQIRGSLILGEIKTDNIIIKLPSDLLRIEKASKLRKTNNTTTKDLALRKVPADCEKCSDSSNNCLECGCKICGDKGNIDKILMCDECNFGYHLYCLKPALNEVPPDDYWYCPACKTDENEIVKNGDKLKESVKRSKMASAHSGKVTRDWGRGMACVGHSKHCTIVPMDHLGPIPGTEVGMCWKFRFQVGEAGVHRPIVAGIHGSESTFAFSIVLSGGYEDDVDNGHEFLYTGSGGRDLSGNKRNSPQNSDQLMIRMNRALANNCNAPFNGDKGAESDVWQQGKPVRVVRSYKARKHSKFAPVEGNRYDGVYKVVKYYPEKGLSGFIVWRYLLRRDDPSPPPWDLSAAPNCDVIYPDGYLASQSKIPSKKRKDPPRTSNKPLTNKRPKIMTQNYNLDPEIKDLITRDALNKSKWDDCCKILPNCGQIDFLKGVTDCFLCVCCCELVFKPVTLVCGHNICGDCLKRAFSAGIYTCPCCRKELGEDYEIRVNEDLEIVLGKLFPGYEATR